MSWKNFHVYSHQSVRISYCTLAVEWWSTAGIEVVCHLWLDSSRTRESYFPPVSPCEVSMFIKWNIFTFLSAFKKDKESIITLTHINCVFQSYKSISWAFLLLNSFECSRIWLFIPPENPTLLLISPSIHQLSSGCVPQLGSPLTFHGQYNRRDLNMFLCNILFWLKQTKTT